MHIAMSIVPSARFGSFQMRRDTMKEIFDEHLSLILPEGYNLERGTDPQGRTLLNFHPAADAEQEIRLFLRNAGKEAELEEEKRNLKSCFHTTVTAKLGEAPGLLWTTHYLLTVVLFEHQRHCYVLSCYKAIQNREELESFAAEAAGYLNELLAAVSIDGAAAEAEPIQAWKILELAGVAEPVDESKPDEEEQRRASEQFMREHPDGEGVSVRAVYRDPITGKVKRDLFWERAGAESGDPEAMIQIAMAYMNGDGVEQNAEKAAEYMQQAAELDEPTAQYNMGIYYLQGQGVTRDFDRAYEWMQRAKENGDTDADGILHSIENVRALREKAEQGDLEAKAELAGTLMTMKGEENFRESVALAQEAAVSGSLKAMWIMGLAYDHGRGVEQSYEKAFRWYLKAAEAGHAPSQANLACLYARGDGVEKDMSKAEEWVRKSAAQGDPDGLRLLRNIDEQAAMDAERAAWEEKWRRQQEEEAKQRAAEWMGKYGQYLEKNPRILINGSKFVFTGVMEDNWPDILQKLMDKGGVERGAVSGKTDYLVVDPRGFGESKVKEALAQRVKGKPVKIVLLEDFLKALGIKKEATVEEPLTSTSQHKEEKPPKDEPTDHKENTVDDKPITSMEEFRRFLQEHPDARITSVQQVSTNPITGKETRTNIYGTPPTAEGRSDAERRPSAKQIENRGFKDDIVAFMEPGMRYTAEEITAQVPSVVAAGLTQNRVTAYLIQLVSEGLVKKRTEGYTNYYSLPGSHEEEEARLEREKAEEERRKQEERRKAEEARRLEEERRKSEEARRQEEERRKAEEARRQEEARRKSEETRRQEEERRKAEEARRQEEERRKAEAAAVKQEAAAREAQRQSDAPVVKGNAGVSKTVLLLAIALTLVIGILIGVLISHAMRGTREKGNPAGMAQQTATGESSNKAEDGKTTEKPELDLQSVVQKDAAAASDFVYVSNGSEIQINGYKGTASDLVIPDEIDGQPVTRIGPQAFSNCETIRAVQLPSQLVEIGDMAFGYLDLEGILILPSTLEIVGGHAFASNKLTGLVIQSSCKLEVNAFANLSELEFIYVTEGSNPDIGTAVFSYAKACTVALLPESMNSIKDETFNACTQLVIYTKPGSFAEEYARRNFIQCNTDLYDDVRSELMRVYG